MNGYGGEYNTIHGVRVSVWETWSLHDQELWIHDYYRGEGIPDDGIGVVDVIATTVYDALDPFFGEGEVFEEVAVLVEEGEILEAGLEVIDTVFVEPVVDYTTEKVEDVIEFIEEPLEELKETTEKYVLYGVGVLALILLLR